MRADDPTLSRLMAEAQAGNRESYTVLLAQCSEWLRRYFARKLPPAQIDDLIQEVLVAVHAKRASYDPARPFFPWLAAIARYRWIDALRRIYRVEEQQLFEDSASTDSDEDVIIARMSLDRLFARLSTSQVEALELVKIEGHSVAEAARLCGQSESAIKVNIHRGLKKLMAIVEKAD